jgi:peptide/nickel transport system substrate-binding protein
MWPRRRRAWPHLLTLLAALALGPAFGLLFLALTATPDAVSDTYVEAIADEPPLLNPVLAPYTLAGQDVLPLVFAGLVRADAEGNVYPDLAEGWQVGDDGREYVVTLRPDLRWHDGQPLTAEDVAFTVRLVQAPDHQGSQDLAELWRGVEVEAVDATTVRFRLPSPLASFAEHLTLGLLPRHLLDGVTAGALPLDPFNRAPIGSGPYRVASLEPDRIVLERFERFHGTPPRLGQIELRALGAREAALGALLDGRVDGLGNLRADEVRRLEASPGVAVYSLPERSKVAMLTLNVQAPILVERPVRQAIARAVDRDRLIRVALGGQGEPSFGPIPVQSWAFDGATVTVGHAPEAAAALLNEAGWTRGADGRREREGKPLALTLLTPDTPDRLALARELARQLGEVGIELTVRAVPPDELVDNYLEPRSFELALVGQWTIGSDPDVYPQWHSSQIGRQGGNYAGFRSLEVDRWLEQGRQETDREARRNAYLHFQARWAEEQPSIMLFHPLYSFAVGRDVRGVAADPLPDSSWRLRDATGWHRVAQPTRWQRARAWAAERAGGLLDR